MRINDEEIKIDDLVKEIRVKDELKKRDNGLVLRDSHIEVLNKYHIDYKKHASLSSLIYEIEEILMEEADLDDLEALSYELSEINYYNYTNK